jgi:catechol 2,3-dioxygenase-like lactoylglutathione lyase family enzyme
MKYEDAYPVVFVDDLPTTSDFYTRTLGLDVLFESDFFLLLALPGQDRGAVAFVLVEHPTAPPAGPAVATGSSAFLTLQVADAAAAFDEIARAGVPIEYPLHDEPWGQRRFGVLDPNGLYLDLVEQIEPDPEFWRRHGVDG